MTTPYRPARHLLSPAWTLLLAAAMPVGATTPAADHEGTTTPAAEVAGVSVEIVRDGGIGEVWRREGSDFPAFGPDGEASVPSFERQALQALANAYDVQFVGLAPAAGACAADCIGGVAVAARVPVRNVADYRLATRIGDGWLRAPAAAAGMATGVDAQHEDPGDGIGAEAAATADFRHALTYSSDGHAWEVLLCYRCGRYVLRRDGVEIAAGVADAPADEEAFDAVLAAAGT